MVHKKMTMCPEPTCVAQVLAFSAAPGVVAALAAAIGQLRGGGFGRLLRHGVQAVHAVARRGEGGGGDLDGEQEGDP